MTADAKSKTPMPHGMKAALAQILKLEADLARKAEELGAAHQGLAWFAEFVIREKDGTPDPAGWIAKAKQYGAQRESEVASLRRELEERNGWLAECFRQSGADPDGNEDWRIAPDAVAEVTRLRKESDETDTKLLAAEQDAAALREVIKHEMQLWPERPRKAGDWTLTGWSVSKAFVGTESHPTLQEAVAALVKRIGAARQANPEGKHV